VENSGDEYLIAQHGSLMKLFAVAIPGAEQNQQEVEDEGL
jgi:hypothetical protein